jgi:SpoVK/Ycf46/Vps4 family AAA+-type ATPase
VGESEKNIRDLFHHALQKSPCVMFFDEIDSIAPARARGNDSGGGVMDRMVSQFLTEMDELRSSDKKGKRY